MNSWNVFTIILPLWGIAWCLSWIKSSLDDIADELRKIRKGIEK